MALTKISGSILKDPLNLGGVSIGGTLTYQDVTNVDSVGLGTFRSGINVSGGQLDVGSNVKIGNSGVATATNFKTGSSNLHSTGLTVGNNFLHSTGINVGTGATIHVPASNTLTFGTNSAERLRIASNGDIGLGTVPETDSYQPSLYFAGGNANIWGSGNANLYMAVNARYTGGAGWKYNNNGVASYVGQQSGAWNFFSAPSGTADATATFTERFRIESDGDLRISSDDASTNYGFIDGWTGVKGNLIIGADQSTTGNASSTDGSAILFKTRGGEKARIQHLGGISFNQDTAQANALDDYEEGTWTPAYNPAGGVSGISYSAQVGDYVKIGRLVMVQFYINYSASSASGAVRISGLPYYPQNYGAGSVMMSNYSRDADRWYVCHVSGNSNDYIYFYGTSNGGGWASLDADAAAAMLGTITYLAPT